MAYGLAVLCEQRERQAEVEAHWRESGVRGKDKEQDIP
jgi:hypothetical protein